MKRGGSILLFAASVGFILIAIVFSFVIDSAKTKNQTDYRAQATSTGSMNFTAVVESADPDTDSMIVNNLRFADTQGESLGTWTVDLSDRKSNINLSDFQSGTKVRITGKSVTFQVTTHTLSATEIKKI